jgi:hypothetical protein
MLHPSVPNSDLQSINKKRRNPNQRQIWPTSGAQLQDTGIKPNTQRKSSLKLYREGSLTRHIAGHRRRGEGRGRPALGEEEHRKNRRGVRAVFGFSPYSWSYI